MLYNHTGEQVRGSLLFNFGMNHSKEASYVEM